MSVAQAASLLGRDRSGLYRRIRAGTLLTDGDDNLVLVDGETVGSVRELVERLSAPGEVPGDRSQPAPLVDVRDPGQGHSDVAQLAARVAQLEQELQLARHEQELERARAAADITVLSESAEEAHASAAHAHELAARSTRMLRERAART